jgi:hypothetical protein
MNGRVITPEQLRGAMDSSGSYKEAVTLGISFPTMRRIRRIKESGVPLLVEMLYDGKLQVNTAARFATLSKEIQCEFVAGGIPAIRRAIKAYEGVLKVKKAKRRRVATLSGLNEIVTLAETILAFCQDVSFRDAMLAKGAKDRWNLCNLLFRVARELRGIAESNKEISEPRPLTQKL